MPIEDKKYLKIGLDFHGVIDKNPQYFSDFTAEALRRGHEVHIITGGPENIICAELKKYKISYSKIFAIMDCYQNCKELIYMNNGQVRIDEDVWNRAKAEYCRKEAIDFHIDDSEVYAKWFSTLYCRYENGSCSINMKEIISFHKTVQKTLDSIENIIKKKN